MKVSLIVAAGGAGRRFLKGKKGENKLFLTLGGRPVLSHALQAFQGIPQIREIILAIPPGTRKYVRSQVLNGKRVPPIRLVPGGATRAESVWKALLKTSSRTPWVLVHDGARPFPPKKEIQALLKKPPQADGVILARPVIPTLKRVDKKGRILETVERSHLFEAQTPQLVRRSVLLQAYRKNPQAFRATDESSLVESVGGRMQVHAHTGWNVKVTTLEDLNWAEVYYARHCEPRGAGRSNDGNEVAVGFGRDTHRLVEGRKLYLGGIHIPFGKGALGHSDGDALLHAISDAILGAVGSGDIGEWFSDENPKFKNIPGKKILLRVLEEARRKGWAPAQVDSVITLERPRLGEGKKKIRQNLARLLGLTKESVSVKAKTMEGLGPEGEGRAVTCEALVLLRHSIR